MTEPMITCRTPNPDRSGTTQIPQWKYDALRRAILSAIDDSGEIAFAQLKEATRSRLSDEERSGLGSLGWHLTTVKLNMECEGEIMRIEGRKPQRLKRCP